MEKFKGLKITIDPESDLRAKVEVAIYNAAQKETVLASIIRFITQNNLEEDFHRILGEAIKDMIPKEFEFTIDDPEIVAKFKKIIDEITEEEKPGEYMA